MITVLFACVHNAGRSQMAAAFFNALADPAKVRALSAGTEPAERIHPEVVETMREVGIDMSAAKPRHLTPELASCASLLITMGCGEACPFVPDLERQDWGLADPKGLAPEPVRAIRDEIRGRVERLVATRGWRPKLATNNPRTEESRMPALPKPIATYITASNAHDGDACAACFTDDAVVRDEAREMRGVAAVRDWMNGAIKKYGHVVEVINSTAVGDKTVVTGRVSGNFPGSPIDLRYTFTLAGEKIARLEIAP